MMIGLVWNAVRAAKWAGGNGLGPRMTAMNFSPEESAALYRGAKAKGATPFACFTFAAMKALEEVVRQRPSSIVQQASLQTQHFPVAGQAAGSRDLVGDWLFGPVQHPVANYDLPAAQRAYEELRTEIGTVGPATVDAFMAKAYGLMNSGAAGFQITPTYNDDAHVMDRCLFMNNYGKRTVDPSSGFRAWNWVRPPPRAPVLRQAEPWPAGRGLQC